MPQCQLTGVPGGLHAPVRLPRPVHAGLLVQAAAKLDTAIYPLAWFYREPPTTTDAVVLGYGNLSSAAIDEGVRRFAQALHESS